MNDSEPNYEHLAGQVREYRIQSGLSQQEVAARGGPSDTTLSQIEAGTWRSARPGPTLRKLETGLGWAPGTANDVAFSMRTAPEAAAAHIVPTSGLAGWLSETNTAPAFTVEKARLAAYLKADPAQLSPEQLTQQIAVLEQETTHLEDLANILRVKLDETTDNLIQARKALTNARHEEAFRRALEERVHDEVPPAVLQPEELFELLVGSLLARQPHLPNHYAQPDFVIITPDGRTVVVVIARTGSDDALERDAGDLRAALTRATRLDPQSRVYGVVVDARDTTAAANVLDVLDRMTQGQDRTEDSTEDGPAALDMAARDIGKPSRGQQKRETADQAGEPPADDPSDMEPR